MIGVINTLSDFILLNLLRVLSHTQSGQTKRLILLNIISASTVASLSFYLNRKYVFKATDVRNHMFIPFLAITLTGIFIIQSAVIGFSLHYFDPLAQFIMNMVSALPVIKNFSLNFYETNIAKACATIVAMFWNYSLYNLLVFRKVKEVEQED